MKTAGSCTPSVASIGCVELSLRASLHTIQPRNQFHAEIKSDQDNQLNHVQPFSLRTVQPLTSCRKFRWSGGNRLQRQSTHAKPSGPNHRVETAPQQTRYRLHEARDKGMNMSGILSLKADLRRKCGRDDPLKDSRVSHLNTFFHHRLKEA